MTFDPFADVPATTTVLEPTSEFVALAQKEGLIPMTAPAVVPQADGKVVVTLKGGTAYDAPWIVIHAANVGDALTQLQDQYLKNLIDRTAEVGQYFAGLNKPAQVAPQQQASSAPQDHSSTPPQQQAPSGEQKFCAHGEMQYKTGVSKAGKTYKGFFCSSQDRNAQCSPQWAK